jgi:hypothetical protein
LDVRDAPAEVMELYRGAVVRMSGAIKKKSLREYEKEMNLFLDWCQRWKLPSRLPVAVWQVMAYAEWVQQVRGPGVARKVIVCIDKIHVLRLAPLPKAPQLEELKEALDRMAKRNRNPEKKSDLPASAVLAWAQRLKESGGGSRMDQQVLVGLALGLRAVKRAGDLEKVRISDVKQRVGGGVTVFFPETKNHPEGELVPIEASGELATVCPARLVLEWAKQRRAEGGKDSDLLFIAPRGGAARSVWWTQAVRKVVHEAEERGWVDKGGKWSSGSIRSGGATSMQALGYGEAAVMALGGWMSTAMQYYLRKNQLATDGLSSKMFSPRQTN